VNRWHISRKAKFQGEEGRREHVGDVVAETEADALLEAERKFGQGEDLKAFSLGPV